MEEEYKLNDIADELLIVNKITIEKLFELDNCVDCVALYMLLYKTTKWQKTNVIKANDVYIAKCLKWGKNKVTNIKRTLKENGLINIIQRRTNGKIDGWYIEVTYLINRKTEDKIKTKVIDNHNLSEQEVVGARTCSQDTNAYIQQYKCLLNKYKMLIEENNKLKSLLKEDESKKKKTNVSRETFKKPTIEEVKEYCEERKNNINAEYFIDYYNSNGWKVGKNSMKDWKAAIRTWERNDRTKRKDEKLDLTKMSFSEITQLREEGKIDENGEWII